MIEFNFNLDQDVYISLFKKPWLTMIIKVAVVEVIGEGSVEFLQDNPRNWIILQRGKTQQCQS